ncbi:MAG: hypothetical protein Q8S00_18650 [Deltaproteobacteria bacterium]|nr:hypothetical protein [Deltaproteobacteria bacterium]MDZ4346903.1 hypothetical protein [Candidatus Binatia bacterium]
MKKQNDNDTVEQVGLSEADKEFLRRDRDQRVKKDTGETEISAMQTSAEVVGLLREADEIERLAEIYRPVAKRLLDEFESYRPLDIAVGAGRCSSLLEQYNQLRKHVRSENCRIIHEKTEGLGIATARNPTVSFVETLRDLVRNHRETIDSIPRLTAEFDLEIKGYVQRKKNLSPNAIYAGNEAKEGVRPASGGGEIRVISNLKDHPKPSWD